MSSKVLMMVVASVVVLAAGGASAQSYYGGYGQSDDGYGQGYNHQPYGDYQRYGGAGYGPYQQFRGVERHIQSEIASGLREDLIERDDARDLMAQLRDIQRQEWREYRVHGTYLPGDDQERIQARLNELDRLVDQIRDQQ